jgi:hypothetical protein
MNHSAELLELYQQWKSLTEQEGAAIHALNWSEVRRCQKQKQLLQPEIIRVAGLIKSTTGVNLQIEARIRDCINELIQLESTNSAALEKRLESARKEMDDLDQTSHKLRQVHKSYAGSFGSSWSQYS